MMDTLEVGLLTTDDRVRRPALVGLFLEIPTPAAQERAALFKSLEAYLQSQQNSVQLDF